MKIVLALAISLAAISCSVPEWRVEPDQPFLELESIESTTGFNAIVQALEAMYSELEDSQALARTARALGESVEARRAALTDGVQKLEFQLQKQNEEYADGESCVVHDDAQFVVVSTGVAAIVPGRAEFISFSYTNKTTEIEHSIFMEVNIDTKGPTYGDGIRKIESSDCDRALLTTAYMTYRVDPIFTTTYYVYGETAHSIPGISGSMTWSYDHDSYTANLSIIDNESDTEH